MLSINPATGDELAHYNETSDKDVDTTLDAVSAAHAVWAHISMAERSAVVTALGLKLRELQEEFAQTMMLEMGKPISQARNEVEKSAGCCDYYAAQGPQLLDDQPVDIGGAARAAVRYRPLGVVLALMPWNYPVWQVIRCAAPILMAGNTLVLKHAANVSGSALLLERVFRAVRPDLDLLRTVIVSNDRIAGIIADDRVAGVTLTGSERAGLAVAQACAEKLKPSVLELGGSDPYLVLPGADVSAAAKVAAWARFQNAGQSCIAAKRMIVTEAVADQFTSELIAHTEKLSVGDPSLESTEVGPMARIDLRDELHSQVTDTVTSGATLLLGGVVEAPNTAFYPPTIVAGVHPGMRMFDEETFGPAAAITVASSVEDAVKLANTSRYGLSSAAWSQDESEITYVREHLESGGLFVNGMTASDPRLPFGGIKMSGWGRELGEFGLREFTNVQAYRHD